MVYVLPSEMQPQILFTFSPIRRSTGDSGISA